MDEIQVAVILPAAGLGRRFAEGAGGPSKIERDLAGKPAFLWAIDLFQGRRDVRQILLAVNPDQVETFRFRWAEQLEILGVQIVPGGRQERWETVLRALEAVDASCTHVAVHDAARPMTAPAMIDRVFSAAHDHPAVIPGVPASNTLKRVGAPQAGASADPLDAILGGAPMPGLQQVLETVDRAELVEVQTPQVFAVDLLRRAYQQIADGTLDGVGITDDASLVEALGEPVMVVEGDSANLKLTRPADAELITAVLEKRQAAAAKDRAAKRLFLDDDED